MSKYRSRWSSGTLSAAPQALAQRAPATPLKSSKFRKPSFSRPVSRFQLDDPMGDELLDDVDTSPLNATVQEEFHKYTTASLSPFDTDILDFWKVSYTRIKLRGSATLIGTIDQQDGISNVIWNCR
jgi:hypothetical protein